MQSQGHQHLDMTLFEQQKQFNQVIQDKERLIVKLADQVSKLTDENERLKQQLQQANNQCNILENKLKSDPLYNIFANESSHPSNNLSHTFNTYEELENKIAIYHQQLSTSNNKISMLEVRLTQRQNLIKNQQLELIQLRSKNTTLSQNKTYMQRTQIQSKNRQINQLISCNQTYDIQNKRLLADFVQLKNNMEKRYQQNAELIQDFMKKIDSFTSQWTLRAQNILKSTGQNQPSNQNDLQKLKTLQEINNKQKIVMQELGNELQTRNRQNNFMRIEMNNLKGQNGNMDLDYYSKNHSTRQAIETFKIRQKKYLEMLQKFRTIIDQLKQSKAAKQHISNQFDALKLQMEKFKTEKQQFQVIKKERQSFKNLYEKTKQQLNHIQHNMLYTLQENQAFHNFFYLQYGNKIYADKIKEEVKKYEDRQRVRGNNQKWANVTELINMNKKLTLRLKNK